MRPGQARVLLTGAGGGIGQAVARALVAAGASVLLQGRSPARLATQARALGSDASSDTSSGIEWHAADLNRTSAIEPLAQAAADWGCNVVIHSAGLPAFGRLESLEAHDIAQVMHLNLVAPMLLTRALMPHLHTLPQARIIFVGSVLGRLGLPGYSVYSASKFGLRGFSEALRRELGDSAIGVQYLGPRTTQTAFNSEAVNAYNRATGAAADDPDVVAHALLKLLESGAAERFVGFPESLAVRINGLSPRLLDPAFSKHRRSLPPMAAPDQSPPQRRSQPATSCENEPHAPLHVAH